MILFDPITLITIMVYTTATVATVGIALGLPTLLVKLMDKLNLR